MTDPRVEEELAHLRRTTEELSEVVARQEAEIERLTRLVTYLMDQASQDAADRETGVILTDQPPPHW